MSSQDNQEGEDNFFLAIHKYKIIMCGHCSTLVCNLFLFLFFGDLSTYIFLETTCYTEIEPIYAKILQVFFVAIIRFFKWWSMK